MCALSRIDDSAFSSFGRKYSEVKTQHGIRIKILFKKKKKIIVTDTRKIRTRSKKKVGWKNGEKKIKYWKKMIMT